MATISIEKQELDSLIETNNYYKEVIDTYEALKIGIEEKKNGKIKELNSLSDLV